MSVKWRYWAMVIVLVLLNYIIFSTALTLLFRQQQPQARSTRTPLPTFTQVTAGPVAWIVAPTNTPLPPWSPGSPTPLPPAPAPPTEPVTSGPPPTSPPPTATTLPTATATPLPPTATPTGATVTHTVKRGETLSGIAKEYGVPMQSIVAANDLDDPNHIVTGQELIIPLGGPLPPTPTRRPTKAATAKPTARPTAKPPTATPKPAGVPQFTAEVIWDPLVAPNCNGPAISKESVIRDAAGNPINGVRVEVNCYDNIWLSRPSGNPGEYEPGHYDFSFGQTVPQDWTCTARVFDLNGQPVASSQVVTIHFDTNDCKPGGIGHQVAIVNWTKNW